MDDFTLSCDHHTQMIEYNLVGCHFQNKVIFTQFAQYRPILTNNRPKQTRWDMTVIYMNHNNEIIEQFAGVGSGTWAEQFEITSKRYPVRNSLYLSEFEFNGIHNN